MITYNITNYKKKQKKFESTLRVVAVTRNKCFIVFILILIMRIIVAKSVQIVDFMNSQPDMTSCRIELKLDS